MAAVVQDGNGVDVVQALAGTGKTFTARAIANVYREAHYNVIGVAPTGRAARELRDQAGIEARTLDSWLLKHEGLTRRTVIVLDEAGMAPTRKSARLLEAAEQAGAKVIAIGDPGQLHSVQAGGWLKAVGDRVGRLELTEVQRQRDSRERGALASLHDGRPQHWLAWAQEHERLVTSNTVLQDWARASDELGTKDAVMIARSNALRASLNREAREHQRERGALGRERSYGSLSVAEGDRVICRLNDRHVDVDNGTRGTVRKVGGWGLELETDAGTIRQLPAAYVADYVEHAYALTGHGVQGGTVEAAFVVAEPHELTKGWAYTALSRARGETRLYVIDDQERDDRSEIAPGEERERTELGATLTRYMIQRDDEDLALEQLPPPDRGLGLEL